MIGFLTALVLGTMPAEPRILGSWTLDSAASRFGPLPASHCKRLDFSPAEGGLTIAFTERLVDGTRRETSVTIVADGAVHDLPAPATLSPVDGGALPATGIAAEWKAGSLVLAERVPIRADAWRRTTYYLLNDAELVQETHVHDVVGDRHARLVYRKRTPVTQKGPAAGC